MIPLRFNKRTLLGWQLWGIGAINALVPGDIPLALPLIAVGVYLVVEPALASRRSELRIHRYRHSL